MNIGLFRVSWSLTSLFSTNMAISETNIGLLIPNHVTQTSFTVNETTCCLTTVTAWLNFLWPPYVIGQAIIFLPYGFFLFFLALSQQSDIGCLPYFHTWCGFSANLACRSETCWAWLVENTGRKKSPSAHHHTTLSGYIFATEAHIDNRK